MKRLALAMSAVMLLFSAPVFANDGTGNTSQQRGNQGALNTLSGVGQSLGLVAPNGSNNPNGGYTSTNGKEYSTGLHTGGT